MNRLPAFVAVGPGISWLMCVTYLVASVYPKPVFDHAWYWPASMIFTYMFTVPAMLAAGWIDRKFADRWWSSLACFAAGFGLAVALYHQFMHEGTSGPENAKLFRENWFYVGLVWGLPAAMCSWLVSMKAQIAAGR